MAGAKGWARMVLFYAVEVVEMAGEGRCRTCGIFHVEVVELRAFFMVSDLSDLSAFLAVGLVVFGRLTCLDRDTFRRAEHGHHAGGMVNPCASMKAPRRGAHFGELRCFFAGVP